MKQNLGPRFGAALLGGLVVATSMAQAKPAKTTRAKSAKATKPKTPRTVTTKSGLRYQDLKVGKGTLAVKGKTVRVHYKGSLTNGQEFDQSYKRGEPFKFALGAGQVIRGWDEGVAGMRVGGKRRLVIPPALGYGAEGAGGVIPPNATLVFVVELLGVG